MACHRNPNLISRLRRHFRLSSRPSDPSVRWPRSARRPACRSTFRVASSTWPRRSLVPSSAHPLLVGRRPLEKSKPSSFKNAPPMRNQARSERNGAQWSAMERSGGPKRTSISFLFLPFLSPIRDLSRLYGRKAGKISFLSAFPPDEVRPRSENSEDERRTCRLAKPSSRFWPPAPDFMLHPCFHACLALGLCSGDISLGHNMNIVRWARKCQIVCAPARAGQASAIARSK